MDPKMIQLNQLLDDVKKNKTRQNVSQMMDMLQNMSMLVPAVLPANTPPDIMKKMIATQGKTLPLPQGVSPKPEILQNDEGKHFLPAFTDEEQMQKGKKRIVHPLTLGVPFPNLMELAQKEEQIDGVVINPFGQNIIVNTVDVQEQEPNQLTQPQWHNLIRQRVESHDLPVALFSQKKELLKQLDQEPGKCLLSFFEKVYAEQEMVVNPYEESDFDAMTLVIREDFFLIRLSLPEKNLGPLTCPFILLIWNPGAEQLRYFAMVKNEEGEPGQAIEVLEDGSKKNLGEAPQEGNELQYIIDLADESTSK